MRKNIDKSDFIYFINLGCSNIELAEVFECSVDTIKKRKTLWGLNGLSKNSKVYSIIDGHKICNGCLKNLPISEYSYKLNGTIYPRCKNCKSYDWSIYHEKNKQQRNNSCRDYYLDNKEKFREKEKRYKLSKKGAVPIWYSDLDKFILEEMHYICAQRKATTNIEYEVDHIIPLNSDIVCGLHWHRNWQILTVADNRQKSNKLLEIYTNA